MARKQLEIAGTEPKRIKALEEKASIYRNMVLSRVDMGKREAQAKIELAAAVHEHVESGEIKVPEGTADGEVVTVYRFDDDDGSPLEIKWGQKEQVRVRVAKEAGDDEVEVLE